MATIEEVKALCVNNEEAADVMRQYRCELNTEDPNHRDYVRRSGFTVYFSDKKDCLYLQTFDGDGLPIGDIIRFKKCTEHEKEDLLNFD